MDDRYNKFSQFPRNECDTIGGRFFFWRLEQLGNEMKNAMIN